MSPTWEDALADCEARLDAAADALDRGKVVAIAPFTATATTEPLPAPLADRARECVARGEELADQLASELERIRAEIRRLPRMPTRPAGTRFEAQA